jgi:REP element-mobilizing transposase RayT
MSPRKPSFQPFDPDAEIQFRERNLPHWFQPGVAIFITFRTADSLPREVVLRNERELREWLHVRGMPVELATWDAKRHAGARPCQTSAFSSADIKQFHKLRDRLFHHALDECHGACLLRQAKTATILAEAILHHRGNLYDLESFVIMPNHVHAIVQIYAGYDLSVVGQSWMRYSARTINQRLKRRGSFWQPEPFDHLIRSDAQFHYLRSYIAKNPEKANLKPGSYLYWQAE